MTKPLRTSALLALLLACWSPDESRAATVTLNSLTDNIMVGQDDTTGGSTSPAAVGDGWFTGTYSGTLRQRSFGNNEPLRTQWYFRFDISSLLGVNPGDITSVTLSLPQIGRLNSNPGDNVPMRIFDPNASWDDDGSNYPVWNLGREAPNNQGGSGGTILETFADAYDTFGEGPTDTSNTNVEGVFAVTDGELLTTVQSWATSGTNNEGLFASLVGADNIGLAFGAPTLVITTIPEPSGVLLLILGSGAALRRRR